MVWRELPKFRPPPLRHPPPPRSSSDTLASLQCNTGNSAKVKVPLPYVRTVDANCSPVILEKFVQRYSVMFMNTRCTVVPIVIWICCLPYLVLFRGISHRPSKAAFFYFVQQFAFKAFFIPMRLIFERKHKFFL